MPPLPEVPPPDTGLVRRAATVCALVAIVSAPAAQDVEFNRDVRPILAENCFFCHGPDPGHRKAKLRLDVAESALAERRGRAAIVPGDAAHSELVARITHSDPDERMPPLDSHKELSPEEIAVLRRWVEEGAPYEDAWSLVPPRRRSPPVVRDEEWCRSFVDRWVLDQLEREELSPSPAADRVTMVRRLYFDLLGLPPTPDEVAVFVTDEAPDSHERLVDRLLASPHHAERLAMYWLDLVRYADTVGYHGDQEHHIAAYRDWVIAAFHANMPFDQFTIEQLAGDLLPDPTTEQIIATGYNRVLQTTHEGGAQAKEYLAIYAADRVRNLGVVWMGATLGCAQCHDHKFDPYTTRDFYAMQAFFADIEETGDFKGSRNTTPTQRPPEKMLPTPEQAVEIARLEAELAAVAENADETKRLKKELRDAENRVRRTMITVSVEPRMTRVLPRGNWLDDSGEVVQPAVPSCMPQLATARRANRLDLARWLTSPDHPQTARVLVNRLWYLFFGRGLSVRLDDLGAQGEWPTHPELLDALAVEFVESGWDVRHMVRLLVTSSAYRQSSLATPKQRERDPDNRLVARQSRWRIQAEMVRDTALSIAELLVRDVGGDSVKPYQPAGYYRHMNFPQRKYRQHDDDRQWRRGVYVHWQRMFLHPALLAFDAPSREECTAQRAVSNTPQAALVLLNDPTFVEASRALATRLLSEGAVEDEVRLALLFERTVSRRPRAAEVRPLLDLLAAHRRAYRSDPAAAGEVLSVGLTPVLENLDKGELAAWTSVARAVLNLNETITRN